MLAAFAAGSVLFALPFLQSGLGETHSHGPGPHMDHAPRHGGALVMIGDHHLEVVETARTIELYLSDAVRRPVTPIRARIGFDGGAAHDGEWAGYRHVADKPLSYGFADCEITTKDGVPLRIRLSRAELVRLAGAH